MRVRFRLRRLPRMFLLCGDALFDIVVARQHAGGRSLAARPGGAPYNVASGLARLGQPVGFLTVLCDDVLGRRLLSFIEPAGVGLSYAVRSERPTAFSLVDLEDAKNLGEGKEVYVS